VGSLLPQHLWEGTKCNVVDVTSVALYLVGWEGLKGHLTKDLSVAILAQDPCGATSKNLPPTHIFLCLLYRCCRGLAFATLISARQQQR
jgi:hypothetical protein